MVTLQLQQIELFPGQKIVLKNISWGQFEAILEALGENRGSRLAYSQKTLEIMTPLPEHEVIKGIIGDLVKIILEELDIACECFGSTTFKRADQQCGVEPDESFYIQNYRLVIGRNRLDLMIDPPPDLVIEIDITSQTTLDIYQALGVPEIWRFENLSLQIYLLQAGKYLVSDISPNFPSLPIIEIIPRYVQQARTLGRSTALKAFRQWLKQHHLPQSN